MSADLTVLNSHKDNFDRAMLTVRAAAQRHASLAAFVAGSELLTDVAAVATLLHIRINHGHKVLICGNGGSAADAQHLAAELMVRYRRDRRPFPAVALNTDTSLLTAHGNDYGFDGMFERQVIALGDPGDVLIALSTSGNSPNIVHAIAAAHASEMFTVALTGGKDSLASAKADMTIRVPSTEVARIQEMHQLIYHSICEVLDELHTD